MVRSSVVLMKAAVEFVGCVDCMSKASSKLACPARAN